MKPKIYLRVIAFAFPLLLSAAALRAQELSKETIRQIEILEQEKASRTPVQQKIESVLLQALREARGQKLEGVNLEPAEINADASGNLDVDIAGEINDNLYQKIEGGKGTVIYASPGYGTVRARINLQQVEVIAALPEVTFIQTAVIGKPVGAGRGINAPDKHSLLQKSLINHNNKRPARMSFTERSDRVKEMVKKYLERQETPLNVFQTGQVNSEGDHAHGADSARYKYGYFGQGIKIGVLSDSYNALNGAATDVTNGELPGTGNPVGNTTPVTVVQDFASGEDEGRAMLQIVHDLAPKAQLFFATADVSEAGFASNIKALRTTYGCDIIIDDVFYYDEPVFQDGIVAQAVNTVTAAGTWYFSSAGNEGSVAKGTAGVWEGDFNNAGSTFTIGSGGTVHNFGTLGSPVNGDIITLSGDANTLNWDDTLGKSKNDYDLYYIRSSGAVVASSTNVQNGSQNPYEGISKKTLQGGDRLVVYKSPTAQIRAFSLNTIRGTLTNATTGQTHGHSSAVNAFSVAAAPTSVASDGSFGPYPGVFASGNHVEVFSSDGLRRMFLNADSTAVTPGNFLFGTSGGIVRNKPDITAADGVETTVSTNFEPFYGTSAAAPHAGAIAGLLKSANPSLTAAQIRTILISTALDIESAGYDNVSGNGVIQAYQAMQLVNPTPLATIVPSSVTIAEGTFSNSNSRVDPGETGSITVQLKNPSLANATSVTGTISTTTTGVTILQNTYSYGNMANGASATNSSQPFRFVVNSSVACGTVINFAFSAGFGGGAGPAVYQFSVTVGATSVSSVLGGTPVSGNGYTATSGTQTGFIYPFPNSSNTCGGSVTNPGVYTSTGSRQYDAYTFANTTSVSQCITVTLTGPSLERILAVAYNSSGFSPSNTSLNYLGEPTYAVMPMKCSFTVPANSAFTVVVYDIYNGAASNSPYTLTVASSVCPAGATCTTVTVNPTTIANGASGYTYSQSFGATGGSGAYTFSVSGTLPTGLSFSDSTLSGTPTQTGSFPITVTATDLAGCPAGSRNYTLLIANPSVVTATSGTPQSQSANHAFTQALQVMVKDASGDLLQGVTVSFTSPASGASGTFPGNLHTVTAATNSGGVATAPAFTANNTPGSYTVTATVSGVTPAAVFSLTNTTPLPVTLGSESAKLDQCSVVLQWTTLNEANVQSFTIEYSTDALIYLPVATLAAHGGTEPRAYSYTHANPPLGKLYYRIRETETSGDYAFTAVMSVQNDCDQAPITVHPNPVKDKLSIRITGSGEQTLTVTDISGRLVKQMNVVKGDYELDVKGWAAGAYQLSVNAGDKLMYTVKVIKQ